MPPSRFHVALTRGAEEDLAAICAYVAGHRSPGDAAELLDALLERIETLERFPQRGNVPKELDALGIREFRQILLVPYRLIYRTVGSAVFVQLIADGRRDMQSLLERRLLGG